MKLFQVAILSLSFVLCMLPLAKAELVVSEVLVNEPGSNTSLEWFEIYNDAPTEVILGVFEVDVVGMWIRLPGVLPGEEYAIVCRNLSAFEGYWGNGSGIWGDDPSESGSLIEYVFPVLVNKDTSLAIRIIDNNLYPVSTLAWTEAGADGISWERESIGSDQIGQSVDYTGSTPGFVNSLTPLSDDLSIEKIEVAWETSLSVISYTVVNRSLGYNSGGEITLYRHNVTDSTNRSDEIRITTVAGLDSAESVTLTERIWLDSMYVHLGASIGDDDRDRNNHVYFIAPASEYPPVILSEIMANPTGLLSMEWVEIQSQVDTAVDLYGWFLGDSIGVYPISEGTLLLPPFEYMILMRDSTGFIDFYPLVTAQIVEMGAWGRLNDSYDLSRLVDPFGITADRFSYEKTFEDNHTWSRIDGTVGPTHWGKSLQPGGSPGEVNEVILEPSGSNLDLIIEPRVFSPDGNGFDDTAYFKIIPPEASSYTMKIYDRHGREVRNFIDGSDLMGFCDVGDGGERYIWCWDGNDDSGRRLPIGIYILYFEATGLESVKRSVVIAR